MRTLLIVGGHSESTILTKAIKATFKNVAVFILRQPSLSVLKGARIYDFQPETITSRVARFTYGI